MPQCLYELGPIIKKQSGEFSQFTHLAFANANPKSNFSQIHSHLLSLLSSLAVRFELKEKPISGFITGRCAAIIIDSKEAGIIGEVHPQVLENFSIEQPVALFELDCAFLP
jgi:phenylalanyl-tRNA synthetase beta chain